MDKYYCSGVLDVINPYFKLISMYEWTINDNYINTGFLLVNLKKWGEENLEEKFIKFINKYKFFRQANQDIINGVIKEKVLIIDPKYNILQPFLDS